MRKYIQAKVVVHKNEPAVELLYNHNGNSTGRRHYLIKDLYANREIKLKLEMSDTEFKKWYKEKEEALKIAPSILEQLADIPEILDEPDHLHDIILENKELKNRKRLLTIKRKYCYMEIVNALRQYRSTK
ncbi:MAG: hypothetical protein AABX83_02445 [Nanoarchaeota archaeon]